jgi:hypothetical protein
MDYLMGLIVPAVEAVDQQCGCGKVEASTPA